ncbi:response regulator [Bacillus thermotolerans]|uniref:Response regulator n=1 Tax=Bacillus thermotolerans TaxID=1221996 RepID=A0A0F5HRQ3_BACTR|nr:response regulator [Bacillus thermotolerans]KKB35705.1 response regulator [Bacillus thermotolerans]KKB36037.1 Transcriptional regulatory protein CitB, DpiA [Bacillus thermotolerans]KKB42715.1 Transcriptional regulatory protein CitB, DpiA [Bacillus thermotolerans]
MLKVVIVEDDFRIAQVQEQFLQKIEGVELAGKALNAKEALDILAREQVDLLLLDIYIPDELGTDLLAKVKRLYPAIDVIMITAANEKHMLETALQYGVKDYLLKPVTMEKFIESIARYKKKKQMLSEHSEVNQSLIDQYFGNEKEEDARQNDLPPGVDRFTLSKVKEIMADQKGGISIVGMAEKMGASRTTARRYLEYLVSINFCKADYDYGIIGRPERKYFLIK